MPTAGQHSTISTQLAIMSSIRSGISSLKEKLLLVIRPVVSMTLAISGTYIIYVDYSRYPRMIRTYERGNILPPFNENQFEVRYFRRQNVEKELKDILKPNFTNSYYLVSGEVGCGKSRTLIEIVREFMRTDGQDRKGAPIYIAASQGMCVGDALANAVNFRFDEHLSFSSFVDYALKIRSFPKRDDHNKLLRALDAIEESAFIYMQKTGKPLVLIIDGIALQDDDQKRALRKVQDKAKLWADANTVKVVFVTNADKTELALLENPSNWSRAASPVSIGDLSEDEAVVYLTTPGLLENDHHEIGEYRIMDREMAKEIFSQVGGRIHHLIVCKRRWQQNAPLESILDRLRDKEREKLLKIVGHANTWKAVELIQNDPDKTVPLSHLIVETSKEDFLRLAEAHVIKVDRAVTGFVVKFESVLTEKVIDEFCKVRHSIKK